MEAWSTAAWKVHSISVVGAVVKGRRQIAEQIFSDPTRHDAGAAVSKDSRIVWLDHWLVSVTLQRTGYA